MKKLMIATAIATSIAGSAAHATIYGVSSDIPLGVELWNPFGVDAISGCGVGTQHLSFGGFAYDDNNDFAIDSTNINFSGQLTYDYSCGVGTPIIIRVTFALTSGTYTAGGPNPGVNFTDGTINVEALGTAGWISYQIIDAAVTNVPFLQGLPGVTGSPQVTAGVVFPALANPVAVNNLPLPGPSAGAGTGNDGISTLDSIMIANGLFLDGNIILTPW